MALNQDFLMGFISGTVVGAVGYKLYEQNSGQLQRLLQPSPGYPQAAAASHAQPSIEELVAQKERLEDLIAELKLG
ncbi:hypothetical protein [Metabacillus iocasae]|uniref:Uncharacterized protein n=1 Tax=Priestia iocasae TaxID=2291674 RepID=A0ABS2R043_9BACI|nr:hypothetical protein [Metabacillus iocasae]MBM7705065.1 hypothetical protein [Metabacillus iocasae]